MSNLAGYIDHTLLKPDANLSDIEKLCKEANKHKFASVCVAPCWERRAKSILDKDVKLCIVQNFPHGNALQKNGMGIFEADEIDFVINIGYVKSEMWESIKSDLWSMRHMGGEDKIVKVIVEVGYLTDIELFKLADMLIEEKIDFIKTCTGYGPRGVTVEDIIKIKNHVGDRIKIKASGGIKTMAFAEQLIGAGADRLGIGSASSLEIIYEKGGPQTHGEKHQKL